MVSIVNPDSVESQDFYSAKKDLMLPYEVWREAVKDIGPQVTEGMGLYFKEAVNAWGRPHTGARATGKPGPLERLRDAVRVLLGIDRERAYLLVRYLAHEAGGDFVPFADNVKPLYEPLQAVNAVTAAWAKVIEAMTGLYSHDWPLPRRKRQTAVRACGELIDVVRAIRMGMERIEE